MSVDQDTIAVMAAAASVWCRIQRAHVEFLLTGDFLHKREIDALLDELAPLLHKFGPAIWPKGMPNPRIAPAMARVAEVQKLPFIEDVFAEADRIRAAGPQRNDDPPGQGGVREPVGI